MTPVSRASLPPQTLQVSVPLEQLLQLAGELLDKGRLDEAENLLDCILTAAPSTDSALHLKGILLFRRNRHEGAAELIERAIQLAPDKAVFRRNLCPIYERIGRY